MERHARYYTTKPRDDAGAAAPFGTTRQEVLGSDRYLSQFFFGFFFIVRTVSGRDVVEVSLQVGEGEESALPSLFKKRKEENPIIHVPFSPQFHRFKSRIVFHNTKRGPYLQQLHIGLFMYTGALRLNDRTWVL